MVTIVLPISRKQYINEVFKCLSELEKPSDTELLLVLDGNKEVEIAVDKKLDELRFKVIRLITFGGDPAVSINARRQRISDIHNFAKYNINRDTDFVFLIEDDTTYPPDTLIKFLKHMEDGQTAFAEGVELGRHGTPYVGAWIADNVHDPSTIISIKKSNDYEQIDAGGLYCCLVDADIYMNHHFEPYDKEGSNGLSCDVNLGLSIKKQGYDCYIDWSVRCDHLSEEGPININNVNPKQVVFQKTEGKWKARTIA